MFANLCKSGWMEKRKRKLNNALMYHRTNVFSQHWLFGFGISTGLYALNR